MEKREENETKTKGEVKEMMREEKGKIRQRRDGRQEVIEGINQVFVILSQHKRLARYKWYNPSAHLIYVVSR